MWGAGDGLKRRGCTGSVTRGSVWRRQALGHCKRGQMLVEALRALRALRVLRLLRGLPCSGVNPRDGGPRGWAAMKTGWGRVALSLAKLSAGGVLLCGRGVT